SSRVSVDLSGMPIVLPGNTAHRRLISRVFPQSRPFPVVPHGHLNWSARWNETFEAAVPMRLTRSRNTRSGIVALWSAGLVDRLLSWSVSRRPPWLTTIAGAIKHSVLSVVAGRVLNGGT